MEKIPQITESELLDYFNGKLSVSEEREVLAWREACDENRRLFDAVRKENLVMREVVRARLIKGDYSAIRERIGGRRHRVFRWWYGVAAAAVKLPASATQLKARMFCKVSMKCSQGAI